MMNGKIGICVITCKRPDFLKLCLNSIPFDRIDEFVIVDDSGETDKLHKKSIEDLVYDAESSIVDPELVDPEYINFIFHNVNKGVAISKNDGLKYLFEQNCEHIFLLEDDIILKTPDIFDKYIEASKVSGIKHFNYGPGSPFNRKQNPNIRMDLDTRHLLDQKSDPNPKLIVEYENNVNIALYEHTVAMFSYFHRDVLEKVGYMDIEFSPVKCWEHVYHTYQIHKAGLTTPFWWFADLKDSVNLLEEAPGAIDKSSIADKKDTWIENVKKGCEIFKRKCNYYPVEIPQTSQTDVVNFLKTIKPKKI